MIYAILTTLTLLCVTFTAISGQHSRRYFEKQQPKSQDLQEGPYFYDVEAINERRTEFGIHPMILGRRSLRQMSGEEMSDQELYPLFEAAKWAPSHFNTQEWRFVYAKRNTKHWKKYLALLSPGNQEWAKDAAALVVMVSNRFSTYKGKKSFVRSHSFDAGAAWMALALEAASRGYVVHAMAGFDYPKAARAIRMPNNGEYSVEVMVAIGKRQQYRGRTGEKTSDRKSIDEFVAEGYFSPRF
ncbi:unnamed protein product [Oppiella nova]|uniref:Nitroreductase domain-containing protein n=1 Tax=Oppiella nova TaxID=334625 RepID=A0A7R9LP88_9ACAR|nr:unnamed protein product [Oppiella nova]CAG2165542.1 unnamed protein product [Oppiella nova]